MKADNDHHKKGAVEMGYRRQCGPGQCEDPPVIRRMMELDKDIPASEIEHANSCETFMFWLSYSLALSDSYHRKTNWPHGENCQERHVFLAILKAAVDSTWKGYGLVDRKNARHVRRMALNEIGIEEIAGHIEHCRICDNYYEFLYFNMIAAQEDYERRIRNRETIRPVIGDYVRDIILWSTLNFLPLENKKLN